MALDNKKSTSLKDGYGTTYQSNGGEFNLDSKKEENIWVGHKSTKVIFIQTE